FQPGDTKGFAFSSQPFQRFFSNLALAEPIQQLGFPNPLDVRATRQVVEPPLKSLWYNAANDKAHLATSGSLAHPAPSPGSARARRQHARRGKPPLWLARPGDVICRINAMGQT